MSYRIVTVSALLLVACSGSAAGVGLLDPAPDEQPGVAIDAAPGDAGVPSKQQQQQTPLTSQDASQDVTEPADAADAGDASTDVQDAAVEASSEAGVEDAGVDAGQDAAVDAAPPPTYYGLRFDDGAGKSATAKLPQAYLNGVTAATYEGWFATGSTPTNGRLFSIYSFVDPWYEVTCAIATSGPYTGRVTCVLRKMCGQCGPAGQVVSQTAPSPGAFFHLALTFDAGNVTLFYNGKPESSNTSDLASIPARASGTVFFGAADPNEASSLTTVDEFRLSVTSLYAGQFTPPAHLSDAQALNLMVDDGAGTTADNGKLTINGAAWTKVVR